VIYTGNQYVLPQEETKKLLYEIMTPFMQQRFEEVKEVDFAYALEGIGRLEQMCSCSSGV